MCGFFRAFKCGFLSFDVIKKDLGSIDVLINNAGIWPTAYVVDMKPEDFERRFV